MQIVPKLSPSSLLLFLPTLFFIPNRTSPRSDPAALSCPMRIGDVSLSLNVCHQSPTHPPPPPALFGARPLSLFHHVNASETRKAGRGLELQVSEIRPLEAVLTANPGTAYLNLLCQPCDMVTGDSFSPPLADGGGSAREAALSSPASPFVDLSALSHRCNEFNTV